MTEFRTNISNSLTVHPNTPLETPWIDQDAHKDLDIISSLFLNNTVYINDSLNTAPDFQHPIPRIIIIIVSAISSFVAVFGNILIITAIAIEPKLRHTTNYFLVSLALADLCIGAVSIPTYCYYIMNGRWTLGHVLCDLWLSVDLAYCGAAQFTIFFITLDRYLSVVLPIWYRNWRSDAKIGGIIAASWILPSCVFPSLVLIYIPHSYVDSPDKCDIPFLEEPWFTFVVIIFDFWILTILMCFFYWKIYRVAKAIDKTSATKTALGLKQIMAFSATESRFTSSPYRYQDSPLPASIADSMSNNCLESTSGINMIFSNTHNSYGTVKSYSTNEMRTSFTTLVNDGRTPSSSVTKKSRSDSQLIQNSTNSKPRFYNTHKGETFNVYVATKNKKRICKVKTDSLREHWIEDRNNISSIHSTTTDLEKGFYDRAKSEQMEDLSLDYIELNHDHEVTQSSQRTSSIRCRCKNQPLCETGILDKNVRNISTSIYKETIHSIGTNSRVYNVNGPAKMDTQAAINVSPEVYKKITENDENENMNKTNTSNNSNGRFLSTDARNDTTLTELERLSFMSGWSGVDKNTPRSKWQSAANTGNTRSKSDDDVDSRHSKGSDVDKNDPTRIWQAVARKTSLNKPAEEVALSYFKDAFKRVVEKNEKTPRYKKTMRTISVVLGVYLLCWTPSHILMLLPALCGSHCVNPVLFHITYWFSYFSSALNPFLYAYANDRIKDTVVRIIRCKTRNT